MRNFYSIDNGKERIKELNITKEMLIGNFIDPRNNQPPILGKDVFAWIGAHSIHVKNTR